MSSRKKVMKALAVTEKTLLIQQMQLDEHKHNLLKWLSDNRLILGTAMLSAGFVGYQSGRHLRGFNLFKQMGRFLFLTLVTTIKRI